VPSDENRAALGFANSAINVLGDGQGHLFHTEFAIFTSHEAWSEGNLSLLGSKSVNPALPMVRLIIIAAVTH
jgi:hypothetical protein